MAAQQHRQKAHRNLDCDVKIRLLGPVILSAAPSLFPSCLDGKLSDVLSARSMFCFVVSRSRSWSPTPRLFDGAVLLPPRQGEGNRTPQHAAGKSRPPVTANMALTALAALCTGLASVRCLGSAAASRVSRACQASRHLKPLGLSFLSPRPGRHLSALHHS